VSDSSSAVLYQEANRRAHKAMQDNQTRVTAPLDISADEVAYYSNPFERLSRMHAGEHEMMTGFGFDPAFPTLHW
jgi:hypothetical protein